MAEGIAGRSFQKEANDAFLRLLRAVSRLSKEYAEEHIPPPSLVADLRGYSEAVLTLSVYKTTTPKALAVGQGLFMMYLGPRVCPQVLALGEHGYCMEYMHPGKHYIHSLIMQEDLLRERVWSLDPHWIHIDESIWRTAMKAAIDVDVPKWALGPTSVIHGDPTLDNVLLDKYGNIRITDPIPPQFLNKPCILAVDHGKMLQSLLGWEVVLRGDPYLEYAWPQFMGDFETARRAVFWAMVALKRIAFRNMSSRVTQWATQVAKELEEICM